MDRKPCADALRLGLEAGLATGKKLETLYDDGRAGALRRLVRLWFLTSLLIADFYDLF